MLLVGIADRQSKGYPGITGDGIPVTVPLYLTVTLEMWKGFVRSAVVVVKSGNLLWSLRLRIKL